MTYSNTMGVIALLLCMLTACSGDVQSGWHEMIADDASFVMIPQEDASVNSILQSRFTPLLDDITASALPVLAQVDSVASSRIRVAGIVLFPGTDQRLQPVWVAPEVDGMLKKLQSSYEQPYAQNEYEFQSVSILDLNVQEKQIFFTEVNGWMLMSESSLGIEKMIRAYQGTIPKANLSGLRIEPGSVIVNTPHLEQWLHQLTNVRITPSLQQLFSGTRPAVMRLDTALAEGRKGLALTGDVPLDGSPQRPLMNAIAGTPRPITLDSYISSNTAGFGIFHLAEQSFDASLLPDTTAADAYYLKNEARLENLSQPLDPEMALATYTQSGFMSTGEYVYIRKLTDAAAFRSALENLTSQGVIKTVEGAYFIQSNVINQVLGGGLSSLRDFYVKIAGDAAILAKRKGLTDIVASDHEQRRVISYDAFYKNVQASMPSEISSLFIAAPGFKQFLDPFLASDNYLDVLTGNYQYISITTRRKDDNDALAVNVSGFNLEGNENPFELNWTYSAGGALTGSPVFGDVGGSSSDEVVFATENGRVYILAGDGSFVQQYSTGRDVPVGSPVIYDWYGTGDNVILVAAGNKIYGWDASGNTLPKFPFELNEQITTPLKVTDLNNNKLPEALVATADRKVHALNGRGNNLDGWPVTTNTQVTAPPHVDYLQNQPAVIAFSANTVHAWGANGNTLSNFPVFVDASLKGSPAVYESLVLGNGVDGNLYAIGNQSSFADSLNVSGRGQNVSAISVANTALAGTPSVHSISRSSGNETVFLTASANGSVFVLTPSGNLRLTKNMGQPIAESSSPTITDINGDGTKEIVALANFGRLYAWNITNGERMFDLPTTSMQKVGIGDWNGNGRKEIVAQTEEGVQSWTINRP